VTGGRGASVDGMPAPVRFLVVLDADSTLIRNEVSVTIGLTYFVLPFVIFTRVQGL